MDIFTRVESGDFVEADLLLLSRVSERTTKVNDQVS